MPRNRRQSMMTRSVGALLLPTDNDESEHPSEQQDEENMTIQIDMAGRFRARIDDRPKALIIADDGKFVKFIKK